MNEAQHIVVIGSAIMDIEGDKASGVILTRAGGVGRAIAENLVRLSLKTEFLTVFGDDEQSGHLREACNRVSVSTRSSIRYTGTPCPQHFALYNGGVYIDGVNALNAFNLLSPERLEERSGILDLSRLIIVDTNTPLVSIEWLTARYGRGADAANFGGKNPPLVFCNSAPELLTSCLPYLKHFTRVHLDARELTQLIHCELNLPALSKAVANLRSEFGLGEVLINLDAGRIYFDGYSENGQPLRGIAEAPCIEQVNLRGVKASALAGHIWALLRGYSFTDQAKAAAINAGLCASSIEPVYPELIAARLIEKIPEVKVEFV